MSRLHGTPDVFLGEVGRRDRQVLDARALEINHYCLAQDTYCAEHGGKDQDGRSRLSPYDAADRWSFNGNASKARMEHCYGLHRRAGWTPVPAPEGHAILRSPNGKFQVRWVANGRTQARSHFEKAGHVPAERKVKRG